MIEQKTPAFLKSTLIAELGDGLTAEGPLVNFVKNNVTSWPFLLLKHHLPMDFEKYNIQQPTYINVIRDPADWFQSHYYFERFGWTRKEDDRGSFIGSDEDKQRVNFQPFFISQINSRPWISASNKITRSALSRSRGNTLNSSAATRFHATRDLEKMKLRNKR